IDQDNADNCETPVYLIGSEDSSRKAEELIKELLKPKTTIIQIQTDILDEIYKQKFKTPSPIQAQGWPVALQGLDLIGIAQTGTGKTLAFLLPALIHIDLQPVPRSERGGPNVLILSPTRELALQIEMECNKYHYRGIKGSACHAVTQIVEFVAEEDKRTRTLQFIDEMEEDDKVLIFVGRKTTADDISSDFSLRNISVQCIHGGREQMDREQALLDFKDSSVRILIATDVASRGLDIKDITHVFNFDFPHNIEEYEVPDELVSMAERYKSWLERNGGRGGGRGGRGGRRGYGGYRSDNDRFSSGSSDPFGGGSWGNKRQGGFNRF
uniref:RNA helicase n=1 Tax=Saccoglossus kowalevskii TaxID=10224 RepID=A0ABM0MEB8_SACKO